MYYNKYICLLALCSTILEKTTLVLLMAFIFNHIEDICQLGNLV